MRCKVCGGNETRTSEIWYQELDRNDYPDVRVKVVFDRPTCIYCVWAAISKMSHSLQRFFMDGEESDRV